MRTIRVEVARVGGDALEVTGRLVDEHPGSRRGWFGLDYGPTIHDMSLTVRVRYPDLVLTAVSGSMATHPYTLCPDALGSLEALVGLSVAKGFTRAVNERLGREKGCAHLTALVTAMAPAIKQGAAAAFRDAGPPDAEQDLWFVDTCQAWRAEGPLHRSLVRRDLAGLRALMAGKRTAEGGTARE